MFNNFDKRCSRWIFGTYFAGIVVFFNFWMGCVVMSSHCAPSSLINFCKEKKIKFILMHNVAARCLFEQRKLFFKYSSPAIALLDFSGSVAGSEFQLEQLNLRMACR